MTPMTEAVSSPSVPEQQAYACLKQGDYAGAANLYEALIATEPAVQSHYWYLGLVYLLQGQEAEAQATWMLPMMDAEAEQLNLWTADLLAVLQQAAEYQEALSADKTAWLIRQHIRELAPENLTNLLRLIQLSIAIDTFTATDISDYGLIALLQSQSAQSIDPAQLQQTLKSVLKVAPLEPIALELSEACLRQAQNPYELIYVVMNRAIEVAYGLHRPAIAIRYVQGCLQVYPDDLTLLSHLSCFYQLTGQHEEAIQTAERYCIIARALHEQVFGAFLMMRALMRAGRYWEQIFAIFEHQDALIEELTRTQTEPLDQSTVFQLVTATFCYPYIRDSLEKNRRSHNRLSKLCQHSIHEYAKEQHDRYRQGLAERRRNRDTTRPLRIGYASHCLKQHSVGWLSRWLFQYHDRERFQIYGYFWHTETGVRDELQAWFIKQVHQARLLGRDSKEIADQIFADDIDILIDLDSLTADILAEVIALKPAPIQATWLGWDASGLPAIDYFIADPYVLPEGAEAHYSEKIWRLPQTYIAVDGFEIGVPTLRRQDLGIPADAVVYWSGQSFYKRHPETVRSQMRILKAVPNSYFLIKGITDEVSIQDYFTQMATLEGIDPARLRFLPEVASEAEHRANLSIADVILDTYPYNGATTTLETLWMGIPLVTRVGEHFSSRNSYTMMMNVGLTEGIAWTEAEYIEWGIRFGLDPQLRQQVAWKLWQSRQTAPLWNARAYTQEMEMAYEQMWKTYLRSEVNSV